MALPRRARWPAGLLALTAVVLFLGSGWWVVGRRTAGGATGAAGALTAAPASIAVLPFANLTGDAETQPFTDGVIVVLNWFEEARQRMGDR